MFTTLLHRPPHLFYIHPYTPYSPYPACFFVIYYTKRHIKNDTPLISILIHTRTKTNHKHPFRVPSQIRYTPSQDKFLINVPMDTLSEQFKESVTISSSPSFDVQTSKYDEMRLAIDAHSKIRFLNKPGVLEWLYGEPDFIQKLTKESENEWGCNLIGKKSNQWTTILGEYVLEDILRLLKKNPRKIQQPQKGKNGKKLDPDRETDTELYECKARNYTTTGTAGEKILGCPIKYAEVSRLYGKPLTIVCMAYQQKEAEKDFMLFASESELSIELKSQLQFWKEHFQICFARATDLFESWWKNQ